MKKTLLFLLFAIISSISFSQIDTLVIAESGFFDDRPMPLAAGKWKDELLSSKTRFLFLCPSCIPPKHFSPSLDKNAKERLLKERQEFDSLLNIRLAEVKVLYVVKPTESSGNDSSDMVFDTTNSRIYLLDFSKMTSLETVYLIGDDLDYIMNMPPSFFHTPAKIIYYTALAYTQILERNIRSKNKNIKLIKF
jgi:hypothetical protein